MVDVRKSFLGWPAVRQVTGAGKLGGSAAPHVEKDGTFTQSQRMLQ